MESLRDLQPWGFALKNMISKDFRVRYRNMALGMLWSVINPLVMLGVITFIFTYVFVRSQMPFFPVFVLIGLVSYNLMSRTITTGTVSVTQNAPLVKKVAFPRMLIPLSAVISQLLDGFIMLCLLVVFIFVFRVPVTFNYLWIVPAYLVELLFILGVSLFTAALNVYYRDMQYLVESILTVMFWLTPIFYPVGTIAENLPPWVYNVYLLNPMAGCVNTVRRAILYNSAPDWHAFGMAIAMSLGLLLVGTLFFQWMQRQFADYS